MVVGELYCDQSMIHLSACIIYGFRLGVGVPMIRVDLGFIF